MMNFVRPAFFSILVLYVATVSGQDELITRNTTYGTLLGWSIVIPDKPVGTARRLDVFVGVPYAQPPIGVLRFSPTQYPDSWSGVRNATSFSPCCPQPLDKIQSWSFGPTYNNTSEDCLYLNIYSPRDINDPSRLHSVMFWIHGGSYRYGSGEEYDGRILAQESDVVVVSMNYRLGNLGFLSTDDNVAKGNYGLWDMVYALRWTRDNIAQFGGDPSMITLFGNSAGGAAVSTLIFSPEAQGLFTGTIPQSGNALSPWAVYRPPATIRPHTESLALQLGCPTDSSQAMIDCLRTKDAMELATTTIPSTTQFNNAFCPRVDGDLIVALPEDLLEAGTFAFVNVFSGTVPDEVSEEYYSVPDVGNGWPRAEKEQRMFDWSRRYEQYGDVIYAAIKHEYDSGGDVYTEQRDHFFHMRGDDGYLAPHTRHAHGHADYVTNTFMYSSEHRSVNHNAPEWVGVPHVEECYYAFGTPLWNTGSCPWGCNNIVWYPKINWTSEDTQVAAMVMETWSNFAKTGNPSSSYVEWPKYNSTTEHIMVIDGETWEERQYYKYKHMTFWNQLKFELINETSTCEQRQLISYSPSTHTTHVIVLSFVGLILLVTNL